MAAVIPWPVARLALAFAVGSTVAVSACVRPLAPAAASPGRPAAVVAPLAAAPIPPDVAGHLAAALDRRHRVAVDVHLALEVAGRQILVYGWDSLTAWAAFHRLEPWERADAEWSAAAELALWLDGLADAGLDAGARALFDESRARCAEGGDAGCEEADLWSAVAAGLPRGRCSPDRAGIAMFDAPAGFDAAPAPAPIATLILDGRRCDVAASLVHAFALDGDAAPELVVEAAGLGSAPRRVDLLVLDDDLATLAARRLVTVAVGAGRGDDAAATDARAWLEGPPAGPPAALVVERFETRAACVEAGCSRLIGGAAAARCGPPGADCPRTTVDRVVLRRDPTRGLWL